MANEFVARNGIIAKANSTISGTLDVSGNITMGSTKVATESWVTSNALSEYATQSYVTTAINNLIDAAPGTLNTLNELAAALGDDPNFVTTVTNSIAAKLPLSGGTLTGQVIFPSAATTKPVLPNGFISRNDLDDTSGRHDIWGISERYYPSSPTASDAWGIQWSGTPNDIVFVGAGSDRVTISLDEGNITTLGSVTASGGNSGQWNTAYSWGNHAGLYASASHNHSGVYAPISHTHSATDITSGTLASARLSGTYAISVSGSAATLTTARTLTVGNTGKTFNGSADVSWSLAEIGAQAASTAINTSNIGSQSVNYATSAGSATTATQVVTVQDDAPAGVNGKLWWESDTGKLKVYYGSSSSWIDAVPIPDMALYYPKTGGSITGDVYVGQLLTVAGNISAANFSGSHSGTSSGTNTGDQTTISGNAGSATVLQTARTLTIGNTGKSFNGSANVSWTLAEIGALGATAKAADSNLFDGIDSVNFVYGNAKGTNDSVTTINDDLDKTGYYTSSDFATKPSGVPNWMYIEHIKLYNNNSAYQKQIGYDTYDDRMWVRTKNSNTWSSWKQIWTSGEFANNSANWDTAYGWGNHASAGYITDGNTGWDNTYGFIARGDTQNPGAAWTEATKFKSSGDIGTGTSSAHSLQIYADNGNDAFMAFHINSDYAVFFGLENATNRLYTGGWSAGANKYQIWDSRDFSSGNISNWNTAYGWGNHASAGYANYNHKYHTFSAGDEYYDSYGQENNLRLFTENATFDNFRFRSYSNVEYFDGTNWVAWGQSLDTLFDGREETGISLGHANSHFRFEINRSSGWPTTALFVIQSSWTDTNSHTCEVTLETWNGSAWVQKDNWTYSNFQRGINLHTTTNVHDGNAQMRVTINMDWVDASHNYYPIRRILLLSNFSGTAYDMQPFTWDYGKNVTFASQIYVSGGNSSQWNTAYGWGDHASAGYLTAIPSSFSTNSITIGSAVTLSESTDRADLLSINSGTSGWGGLQITNTAGEGILSLMIDGSNGGLYDDQNGDWLLYYTENGSVELRYNSLTRLVTQADGVDISGNLDVTGTLIAGNTFVNGVTTGGFGSQTTNGTLDWNDSSNARSGQGYSLLLGLHSNGPTNTGQYFHPFSFEYSSKNGSGNLTQLAIPYTGYGLHYRSRYADTWDGWISIWDTSHFSSTNISNWNTAYGWGNHAGLYAAASHTHDDRYYTESEVNSLLSGKLSSDSDSEQAVGGNTFRFNLGGNRANIDPRWNESGYDANLGVFHMYATTSAGAQWGRTGIALYNGSAYQYLTTRGSTTGIFLNNQEIIHSGTIGSQSVNYATSAGALSSMNISQFSNNSGYITSSASITGNAATATTLQTIRSINGTNFNGSANITTSTWGTARTLTIGNTAKSVNGGGNVSWSLGEIGAQAEGHINAAYVDFTVGGDANTYYIVRISGSGVYAFQRYSISRGYSWPAPNTWNTSSHKGGLTFTFEWSGDTAWGGNDKSIRVVEFGETYSTMVAGMVLPVTGGVIVWLRGGGAQYRLHTPLGASASVTVEAGNFTAGDSSVYTTRTDTSNVTSEIYGRWPVRNNNELYVGTNAVIHAGNIGSQSVNYAASSGSTTGNAATATKLQTARSIALGGDVTGSANFDGSGNITITATVADNSHSHTNYAPLASPALTGTPTAPTASAATNTTQIATTAFVKTAISDLVSSAPDALDTLNELATALGNDANFATTVTNSLATKASSSHTHAISDVTGLQSALDGKQAAGSYAASNHNHTYNVNDSWLRENGDNATFKIYGNTRQMVFRTDGAAEYASGVGGYPFAWMYGGDAASNRRMLLNSDGRLWSSYHGWLDDAFASLSHTHTIADVTGLQGALDGKQAAGSYAAASHTHDDRYYTESESDGRFVRKDTTGQYLKPYNEYTSNLPASSVASSIVSEMGGGGLRVDFLSNPSFGSWAHAISFSGYNGYNMYQLAGHYKGSGGLGPDLYVRCEPNHARNSWSSWEKLWHTGNDGSGSGLDADLLDGLELHTGRNNEANKVVRTDGSGYLNVGWINSTSGAFSSGINKIYCSDDDYIRYQTPTNFISNLGLVYSGNIASQSVSYANSAGSASNATTATQVVTIQDAAPTGAVGRLWWESDTGKLKVYYGSAWVDATPVPDMSLYYSVNGGAINGDVVIQQTLTVIGNTLIQGTLTETSDISLKENILPLESSLDKVMQLKGVSFNKKATPELKEIGFIAQEVEEVIPELVAETEDGIKTVSYSRVTAVLVETIKEQQAQIDELKDLVAKLSEKINSL